MKHQRPKIRTDGALGGPHPPCVADACCIPRALTARHKGRGSSDTLQDLAHPLRGPKPSPNQGTTWALTICALIPHRPTWHFLCAGTVWKSGCSLQDWGADHTVRSARPGGRTGQAARTLHVGPRTWDPARGTPHLPLRSVLAVMPRQTHEKQSLDRFK